MVVLNGLVVVLIGLVMVLTGLRCPGPGFLAGTGHRPPSCRLSSHPHHKQYLVNQDKGQSVIILQHDVQCNLLELKFLGCVDYPTLFHLEDVYLFIK